MGQKNFKGTVSISDADDRIRLRWRYQSKRYSINLSSYNKTNLLKAKKTALNIEQDMANDRFDYTLNRYKGVSV
jgi:integrase